MSALAAELYLVEEYGGESQIRFSTKYGPRIVDNLAGDTSREAKVGKVYIRSHIKKRIKKDEALLSDPFSGINLVEWHFFPGKNGIGPSRTVKDLLDMAGIRIIIH